MEPPSFCVPGHSRSTEVRRARDRTATRLSGETSEYWGPAGKMVDREFGAEVSWIGPEERCTAETGADGVARCKGMLAARTSVSCWSPRHGPVPDGQLGPEAVEVFPEGQLVEMAYRRGVPFTVVVKDSSGTGLPGVRIMPVSPGRAYMPRQGTTGLDGSCTFAVEEGLEFDELHVQWRSPQGGSTDATRHRVDTDSGELVVVLDPRR